MVTKTEALMSVRKTLDGNHDVREEDVVELECGWILFPKTKRFIETGDDRFAEFGTGGILVERGSGRHLSLPSGLLAWPLHGFPVGGQHGVSQRALSEPPTGPGVVLSRAPRVPARAGVSR
jgi:Immunity protein 35